MRFLAAFNKEQLAAAATAVVCALFLAGGVFGGGVTPVQVPPAAGQRDYEKPHLRPVEFLDEKFDRYWQGRNIFHVQTTSKQPVPPLRPPEPREEDLAAPLFRPGPLPEVYNRAPLKAKYLTLTPSAPAVNAADLPPAPDLEALKTLEEPAVPARRDRRGERERQFCILYPKTGNPQEGTIIIETSAMIRLRNRRTNSPEDWKKDLLNKWEYNHTFEEQYAIDSRRIKPGPQEAADRVKLARKLIELGMTAEARDELRKAADVRKDHSEAYVLLAQTFVDEGNFDSAVSTLESGIAAGGSPAELYYEIGRCHRALSFLEGALAAFEKSVDASPRFQRGKLALARAQLDLGKAAAAFETANDFFVKRGSDTDVTAEQRVEGYVIRGVAQLRTGAFEKARQDLGEALKLDAQNAEATNALGVMDALDGNFRQAGARFVQAVRAQQYLGDAWLNLGALLLLAGKWPEAEAVFTSAQQRDPVSAEPVAGLALVQILTGKREGLPLLERAGQLDPRHAAGRAVAGVLKLREQANEEALGFFVAALRADSAYLPSYHGAAIAYLRSAQKASAEAGSERDEAKSAELYRRAQELRVNAETLLKTVRDFDPGRAGSWLALGCAYARMNRPEEARAALTTALQLMIEQKRPIDPLLQYTRGYVEYWYGPGENEQQRLDYAATLFAQGTKLEGESKDPVSVQAVADCKIALELIENWKATSVRVDERFEREAGPVVGANWVEGEEYNVDVSIDGGRCKFSGKQGKADLGMTYLERLVPSDNFHSLEATFIPESVQRTEYGLSIYYLQQAGTNIKIGFHVGVDMRGKVRYNAHASFPNDMDRKGMEIGWTEVKTPLPNPKEITLRITRGQRGNTPQFTLWYWDPAKRDWILAQKDMNITGAVMSARGAPWHVTFWARAWRDQEYTLYVDNVRIHDRARR